MIRQGSGQFGTWRRQPGRPRKRWVEQVTTSTGLSLSDAWNVLTDRSAERERERERERATQFAMRGKWKLQTVLMGAQHSQHDAHIHTYI